VKFGLASRPALLVPSGPTAPATLPTYPLLGKVERAAVSYTVGVKSNELEEEMIKNQNKANIPGFSNETYS
jgi:hypothetical protein